MQEARQMMPSRPGDEVLAAPFEKQAREVAASANSMLDLIERGQVPSEALTPGVIESFRRQINDEATLTRLAEHEQRMQAAGLKEVQAMATPAAQQGLAGLVAEHGFEQTPITNSLRRN